MSGLFGVVTTGRNCVHDLFYGTDYHSHCGDQRGGMSTLEETILTEAHSIRNTQFKSRFAEKIKMMKGSSGIGVISDSDDQPIARAFKGKKYAIAMAGLIANPDALMTEVWRESHALVLDSTGNETSVELIAKAIHQAGGFIDGINTFWNKIEGSASILVLTEKGIIAARDRFGRTPLFVGRKKGAWAVSSENFAFDNLGYRQHYSLGPGEIVLITKNKLGTVQKRCARCRICAFLWIYVGFPAACYEGHNVEIVRNECGAYLARRDIFIKRIVDNLLVAGVPDSGVAHAIGYENESGLPYGRPLVKYPSWSRSYIPPSQAIRNKIARMKLVPIPQVIKDKRIILCEDSIVRGTQLRQFTVAKLKKGGAKEIHIRPACPPLMYPCRFLRSTRTLEELAARQAIFQLTGQLEPKDIAPYLDFQSKKYAAMVEIIRKSLGVTTLMYQRLDDMIAAIGLPSSDLCTYCWTGED